MWIGLSHLSTAYAVGVVFLALLNFQEISDIAKKTLLYLIPGPKEPSCNINSFLEPLVHDLLNYGVARRLWCIRTFPIRAALLCLSSCDSPAMRKVAGFCPIQL